MKECNVNVKRKELTQFPKIIYFLYIYLKPRYVLNTVVVFFESRNIKKRHGHIFIKSLLQNRITETTSINLTPSQFVRLVLCNIKCNYNYLCSNSKNGYYRLACQKHTIRTVFLSANSVHCFKLQWSANPKTTCVLRVI